MAELGVTATNVTTVTILVDYLTRRKLLSLIPLASDQKAQLVGWVNREKDFMMSIRAMAERIIMPRATGTLELIKNDYEWLERVKESVKESGDGPVDLGESDVETLVEIARANNYADRREFWRSIVETVETAAYSKD